MIGEPRYEKLLGRLPKCCRDDFDRYFRQHILPRNNKELVTLLCGEQKFKPSPFMREIRRAHAFLYAMPEEAWGSPEIVAAWVMKGEIARDVIVVASIITIGIDLDLPRIH